RLPFFRNDKGILGHTLGGWQFSTVVKLAHGTPFTVTTTGVDLNLDSFAEPRPVLLDSSILGNHVSHPRTSLQNLPRAAFRTLTTSDFNVPILGRNTFYIDGTKNVDFGIQKNFNLPWEDHKFTLRADLFNAFNHVQYGFPVSNITLANFGAITGAAASYLPRNIQISLRYTY
ncbi:MAG TPA: hypothetical protein VJT71_06585, partial [Pyrinomonadaceae bacterium]|nr:hypothetical protein [Pyrinomonadaceae bacterium]